MGQGEELSDGRRVEPFSMLACPRRGARLVAAGFGAIAAAGYVDSAGPANDGISNGSFERGILVTGTGEAWIDDVQLSATPSGIGPGGESMRADTRGFRYPGSRPQSFHQFYLYRLEEHFDIVGFVRRTDSTRYLLPHEF